MSSGIKMQSDLSGLREFVNDLDRNQKRYFMTLGKKLQEALLKEVKRRAPEDTGEYKKSWKNGEVTVLGSKIKVTVETPQGELFVILEEEGSEPHEINGPVLIKGNWRYIIDHPGFAPIPHVQPAIRHVMDTQFVKINNAALKSSYPGIFR